MFSIELLYYEEKWEKLCSIIMRFTVLSKYVVVLLLSVIIWYLVYKKHVTGLIDNPSLVFLSIEIIFLSHYSLYWPMVKDA